MVATVRSTVAHLAAPANPSAGEFRAATERRSSRSDEQAVGVRDDGDVDQVGGRRGPAVDLERDPAVDADGDPGARCAG